jgi:hypothetical protein
MKHMNPLEKLAKVRQEICEPTNKDRAERILHIFEDNESVYNESSVADILADLMHFCRENAEGGDDLEFEKALKLGRLHFQAEVDEEEYWGDLVGGSDT